MKNWKERSIPAATYHEETVIATARDCKNGFAAASFTQAIVDNLGTNIEKACEIFDELVGLSISASVTMSG